MTVLSPVPTCIRYTAGHQVHWIRWKQALSLPARRAAFVRLDEIGVMLAVGRGPLRLWNHDLPRMAQAIADHETDIDLWPQLGALRIGSLWFNVSKGSTRAACSDQWV